MPKLQFTSPMFAVPCENVYQVILPSLVPPQLSGHCPGPPLRFSSGSIPPVVALAVVEASPVVAPSVVAAVPSVVDPSVALVAPAVVVEAAVEAAVEAVVAPVVAPDGAPV